MITMGITSLVLCIAGVIIGWQEELFRTRWWVRLIGLAVAFGAIFGAGCATQAVATNIAKTSAVDGFHQFLNGTVVKADVSPTSCTRDGNCEYTYSCDPYTVMVPVTTTDSKGNSHTTYVEETRYHSCPYVTVEYHYSTLDSIGNVVTFPTAIAAQPVEYRGGEGVPDDLPRGAPQPWQLAHNALAQGRGLPMTVDNTYSNYILASDQQLLKASSNDVARLLKANLLPTPTVKPEDPIHDQYDADKVQFVGFKPSNAKQWQNSVMQLNAALGSKLRGDLHIVVVQDSKLPRGVSAEDYKNALKAYWLNSLDKYAFAKNGILVVMGVNSAHTAVEWARSDTGMPVGNGAMTEWLDSDLLGKRFSPSALMGDTYAAVTNGKAHYVIGHGVIPQAVMVKFPFARACMSCTDKNERGEIGFTNLDIPSNIAWWGYFWMIVIDMAVAIMVWKFVFFVFEICAPEEKPEPSYRGRYTYTYPY